MAEKGRHLFNYGNRGILFLLFLHALEKELLTIVVSRSVYAESGRFRGDRSQEKSLSLNHALALSNLLNPEIVAIPLKKEEALQYLRKEEVKTSTSQRKDGHLFDMKA